MGATLKSIAKNPELGLPQIHEAKKRAFLTPGAVTTVAITGIKMTDKILSAIEWPITAAVPIDKTSTCTISSNGNISWTGALGASNVLIVEYWVME